MLNLSIVHDGKDNCSFIDSILEKVIYFGYFIWFNMYKDNKTPGTRPDQHKALTAQPSLAKCKAIGYVITNYELNWVSWARF